MRPVRRFDLRLFATLALLLMVTSAAAGTASAAEQAPPPTPPPTTAPAPPLNGTLEGTWRLVEQRYQDGEANIANLDAPVHLAFDFADGPLDATIWAGDATARAVAWPAWARDDGPVPVDLRRVDVGPARGSIRAHYTVRPYSQSDLVLDIVEEYRLAASDRSGDTLEGKVTVRFTGGETNRGGFTLHRRFERER